MFKIYSNSIKRIISYYLFNFTSEGEAKVKDIPSFAEGAASAYVLKKFCLGKAFLRKFEIRPTDAILIKLFLPKRLTIKILFKIKFQIICNLNFCYIRSSKQFLKVFFQVF